MIGTNRITHISFPDMPIIYHDITTGIADGSLLLDEILLSNGINFGEINSNKFEVQLYDISDVSGQRIVVWQEIEDPETTSVDIVPIFSGIVESSKQNHNGYYREIIAYDEFYTKGNEDISAWWKTLWETYPEGRTIKQLRQALISKMGLIEAYPEYPYINDSILVNALQDEANLTSGVLMKMICELQGTIPNIDREGKIDFVVLADYSLDISDNFDTHDSMFEEYQTEYIDAVYIYDIDDKLIETGGQGNLNPYKIKGNLLIKGIENLPLLAENLYFKIRYMSYTPGDMKYIISDPGIYLGFSLVFENTHSYVFENILSGPLLIEQETSSRGDRYLEEKSSYNSGIASIRNKVSNDQTQYFMIANNSSIHINDGQNKRIIDAKFTSNSETIAIFHAEILLENGTTSGTETIEGEVYDVYNDTDITITYVYNGETLTYYKPKEIYVDGNHILHLLYYIPIEEAKMQHFEVYMESIGGSIDIQEKGINASIYGQNIVGKDDFSGIIEAGDEFSSFDFLHLIGTINDEGEIEFEEPINNILSDNFTEINFNSLVGTFTDDLSSMDKDNMSMFNGDGLSDVHCSIDENGVWTGTGYIISTDIYNTDHIIVNGDPDTTYQISYDGETWVGLFNGQWTENINMTKSQIEAVTQSQWTGYPFRLKAELGSGSQISSIIFVNGNILIQNGGQND